MQDGLSQLVDRVNEVFFFCKEVSDTEQEALALDIASRQGLPGSYRGTFGLTEGERNRGVRLFTGETITSASARHVMGEEACRALHLLDSQEHKVQIALERATANLLQCPGIDSGAGWYCCGTCSVGLWRHLTVGGLCRREEHLTHAMAELRELRKGDGEWRRMPFYYTLSALCEIDLPGARDEMRYCAPKCENLIRRNRRGTFAERRHEVVRRVLSMC